MRKIDNNDNKNSKGKDMKSSRTNFSREFAIRIEEVEKLTEKAYLG